MGWKSVSLRARRERMSQRVGQILMATSLKCQGVKEEPEG